MSATTEQSGATAIRPFQVEIPDEEVEDLRRRIAAARFRARNWSTIARRECSWQTIQALASYWASDYEWGRCEARLNELPQFKTEIDGEDIHFIHVKSPHEDALPLIMTHGWPGSVIELLETVALLTDPTAHGGDAPRTRLTSCCHRFPGTGSRPCRPSSAGTRAGFAQRGGT